ncbi:hypothetical protein ON010_g17447 [Phytophthora cinnamomi]|nr:hypothetical protein ON010_g17447 [Phytophthora cinnamomi]
MQLSETSLQAMKAGADSPSWRQHPPGNVAVRPRPPYCSSINYILTAHFVAELQIKVPNPENARMRATIETYEERIKGLEEEEKKWLDMKATLEADRSSAQSEAESDATRGESETGTDEQQEKLPCELKVTQSVEVLQRSALQQLGSTTEQVHGGTLSLFPHLNDMQLTTFVDLDLVAVAMGYCHADLLDAADASGRVHVDCEPVDRGAEMKKAKLFGAYHDSAFKGYGNVAQPKESLRALLTLPPRGGVPFGCSPLLITAASKRGLDHLAPFSDDITRWQRNWRRQRRAGEDGADTDVAPDAAPDVNGANAATRLDIHPRVVRHVRRNGGGDATYALERRRWEASELQASERIKNAKRLDKYDIYGGRERRQPAPSRPVGSGEA